MDPFPHKLGKLATRVDRRTLKLAKYLAGVLAPAPTSRDWTGAIGQLGEMGNDRLGNCTCAAAGHLIQGWTGNATGTPIVLSDNDIVLAYEAVGGYNPADPSTDNGCVELDVLNYWRNNGIGPASHKIAAYASVNPKNFNEVMQAVDLFGGIYIGVGLPTSAQSQVGGLWDVTSASPGDINSWGGHAIPIVGYTPNDLTCVTWGALQKMTWPWLLAYCDEAYALVTVDWIEANGDSPSGFDIATLQADLADLS